jgi:tetratricopeptide (TPR) repeat protein
LYERATELFEAMGQLHPAARISARLGEIEGAEGMLDEGIDRMERAFQVLSQDEPDADLATLAAQLGRLHFFRGNIDRASEVVDFALGVAEALVLPEVTSQALNTKGIVALTRARPEEALALLGHALKVALEQDLPAAAIRAYTNLSEALNRRDRVEEAIELYEKGLALARRAGNRYWERQLLSELPYALFLVGRWDEALTAVSFLTELEAEGDVVGLLTSQPEIYVSRGAVDEARKLLDLYDEYRTSVDTQERAVYDVASAVVLEAEGHHADAIEAARRAIQSRSVHGADSQTVKVGFTVATDAAFACGDLATARWLLEVVDGLRPVELPPSLRALGLRCEGRLAATRRDASTAERRFKSAAGLLREIGIPFWLGRTLLDHGLWLIEVGRTEEAEPLLSEAGAIFDALGATIWRERIDAVSPRPAVGAEP